MITKVAAPFGSRALHTRCIHTRVAAVNECHSVSAGLTAIIFGIFICPPLVCTPSFDLCCCLCVCTVLVVVTLLRVYSYSTTTPAAVLLLCLEHDNNDDADVLTHSLTCLRCLLLLLLLLLLRLPEMQVP